MHATTFAANRDRFTTPADFLILERIAERHGLAALLTELVTLTSMAANDAAKRSRHARNPDRRANLDLKSDLLFQASEALVRAKHSAACAAAVDVCAPVG